MASQIPGAYIWKRNGPKQRRKAFDRVLSATIEGRCAENEDIQVLIDYCLDVQTKLDRDEYDNKFRPLYEAIVVILPEARTIYHDSRQNAATVA